MITLAIGVVGQLFRVTVTCEEFRAQSTKDGTVQPGKYHGFVAPVARAQTSLTNSLVSSCGDERREDEEGLISHCPSLASTAMPEIVLWGQSRKKWNRGNNHQLFRNGCLLH